MGKISKFSISDKKKYEISEDSAMEQILKMCEYFDIDVDAIEDKKQRKQHEGLLNNILEYIRRGYLEINKDYSIVQHLQDAPDGNETNLISYKRIGAKHKLEMDGLDENEFYARMYAVLGAASSLGTDAIQKLKPLDLKVAECLTIFFL